MDKLHGHTSAQNVELLLLGAYLIAHCNL